MDFINKNITIHVGMPKTATTTLQKNFFLRLPLINYAGFNGNDELSKKALEITLRDDLYYNENTIRNILLREVDDLKPLVISNELSSGAILPLSHDIPQGRAIIASRYKSLFPDAKILIVIRNQYDILHSIYTQILSSERFFIPARKLSFSKWMKFNIEQFHKGWPNTFEFADYYSIINLYTKMFDNVKVVLFEEMIKDMPRFIKDELCPFIGIPGDESISFYDNIILNKRHTKGEIFMKNVIRKSIYILHNYLGNPQSIIDQDKRRIFMKKIHSSINSISIREVNPEYGKSEKQFIKNYYGEGNKKLSKMVNIDLKPYGYPHK